MLISTLWSPLNAAIAITNIGLPIIKSPCLNPLQWQIEQILLESFDLCTKKFESKRGNVKIAKYHQPIVASMLTGVKK